MIIAVDIGNTSIKIAVMDHLNIYKAKRSSSSNFRTDLQDLLNIYPDIYELALCNVSILPKDLVRYLKVKFQSVFEVNSSIHLPFNNHYQSLTLGNDRLALAAGALYLAPKNKPVLVIDAGTCVTYDFVDHEKNYCGGAISPGLRLRYESLHNFTANLPLLEPQHVKDIIGNTTETSIHSGVINGLSLEIKGVIKEYKKSHKDLEVFITGGDSELLIKQLKNRFFATPFLMLHGIYNLYLFNKNL
ncbi:type III pantothenate kinase [Nonlabens sp.]|uniref:type III pantothenate kinase n=1 Tax=Nonlabens sp. TaxID=1888209 RepID=UPI002600EDBF|nr:type III pantothenate kinase [Nonlabens sp.]